MIAVLSVGARLVLYDGSPLHPNPLSQLDIVEKYEHVLHPTAAP